MRIKLIYPSFYDLRGRLHKVKRSLAPPLAVFYIAGLVDRKHTVEVVDETVEDLSFGDGTDLVGISTTSLNVRRAYEIADRYRSMGTRVVLGGIHASFMPQEAQQHSDAVLIGEAENSWPELVHDAENGHLRTIYKGNPPETLEGLRMPRFDLIRRDRYYGGQNGSDCFIPVSSSRGCPHNCSFCSVTRFWGNKVRFRPIPDVVEEIRNCGSRRIFFVDDNFLANPQRTIELCRSIKSLGIEYICQIDATLHGREKVVNEMARAGCIMCYIGFERVDNASLPVLNKGINRPSDYAELIRILHRNRIGVYASMILGLRGDGVARVQEMVSFLVRSKVDAAAFFSLAPLPGTLLYKNMRESFELKDDAWWLHEVKPGKEGLFTYNSEGPTEYDLSKLAIKQFYSVGSILSRLSRFPMPRLLLFALNIGARIRMGKAEYGYII